MPRGTSAIAMAALLCLLARCAPPASQGGFDSDNPASRLYAIEHAGESHDRAAIPQLVECLDSDDPAVRMMAIGALERITGQRLGYDPYAPPEDRQAGLTAWRKAVLDHRFGTEAATRPGER